MKAGLNRLIDTIESMKETVTAPVPADSQASKTEYYTDANDQQEALESLPAAVITEAEKEATLMAAEAKELEQWQLQLNTLLQDRAQRKLYFQQYLEESQTRYQRILQSARSQVSGDELRVA